MREINSFLAILVLLFASLTASAQTVQKGTVTGEDAEVYKDADFDSAIIAGVKRGEVYDISVGKKGPFYKIRLKPGTTGWISDDNIRPGVGRVHKKPEKTVKKKKGLFSDPVKDVPEHDELSKNRSIERKRFRGAVLEFMNYKEDTMGAVYEQSNLLLYGFKVSGNNTVIDGEIYVDSEILFHNGAPNYYSTATGNGAGGFMIFANMLFQTDIPQGREDMFFYGFGPAFKFTHFEAGLSNDPTPGKSRSYSLDDMTLGAVFDAGYAHTIGTDYALRFDARYYWESTRYFSFGMAFQFDF